MEIIREYWENGNLKTKGQLNENGQKEGKWKFYYKGGQIRAEGQYKDDKRLGVWKYYTIQKERGRLWKK